MDTKSEKYHCKGITEHWAPLFLQIMLGFYDFILTCLDLTGSAWLKPQGSVQNDNSSISKPTMFDMETTVDLGPLICVHVSIQENLAQYTQLQ